MKYSFFMMSLWIYVAFGLVERGIQDVNLILLGAVIGCYYILIMQDIGEWSKKRKKK